MTNHLVIGDPHAQYDISNDRFTWLGKLIIDKKPDKIICLGDFADMASLSSYDKGRKSFEGRRFKADINICVDALKRINLPIDKYNDRQRKKKKPLYQPEKYMMVGNHDDRINTAIQLHPELEGTISVEDLQYEEYGWKVTPYRQMTIIDGIAYSHSFPSGVKGEPISGPNIANALLTKLMMSATVGHIHLFDYAIRTKPDGSRCMALSPGCYFEHSMPFAIHTEYMYWRGVVMKHNVNDGVYDLEQISMNEIRRKYG